MAEHFYIDGIRMPTKFEQIKDSILNLEISDEDIWIVSYPKAGTTWCQEMVWMILNNLDFEKGKIPLEVRSPFLEWSTVRNSHIDEKTKSELGDLMFLINNSVEYIKKQKSPVLIKSHLPWKLLPKDIQCFRKRPKIIYIYRKPQDVCISSHYFYQLLMGQTKSLDDSVQDFLTGDVFYGPYWDHVLGFWKQRQESNILLIKFEDMKENLPNIIRKVARFLKKETTDSEIQVLSEHLSFDNMKKNPAVQMSLINLYRKQVGLDNCDARGFYRSGTSNQHKTEFSDTIIKKFDKWVSENTKDTDFVI